MVTRENDAPPAQAPREKMAGVVTLENPAAAPPATEPAAAAVPAAEETATPAPAPVLRRIVGLPARPRLRLSFAFDGAGQLMCDGILMDENRELVRRSTFDPKADPTVERCFSYFATLLVRELAATGALVVPPSAPSPAAEAEPSELTRDPSLPSPEAIEEWKAADLAAQQESARAVAEGEATAETAPAADVLKSSSKSRK